VVQPFSAGSQSQPCARHRTLQSCCVDGERNDSEPFRVKAWRGFNWLIPSPGLKPANLPTPIPAKTDQPRLEITITEAVIALDLNEGSLWILLNAHVNGPTVKVTGWALTLRFADGGARAALWNQKPGSAVIYSAEKAGPSRRRCHQASSSGFRVDSISGYGCGAG
jgi:hypothetical protein